MLIMSIKSKRRGKTLPLIKGVSIGALLSIFLLSITSTILAWLVYDGKISVSHLGYASMGMLFASGWMGAMVSIRLVQRRLLLVGGSAGTLTLVALILINFLLMGGNFQGVLITVVMVYLGSLGPVLIGMKNHNRGAKKRRHQF